jgi:glycosyltransferase involved in cell wall biosynthesis
MRILFLTEGLWAGGRERRLVELLKGISKNKAITCELVSLTNQVHYTQIFDFNIKIHFIEKKYKIDPFIPLQLYKIYKQFKPDIIHSWGEMWSLFALPVIALTKSIFINGMITSAPENIKIFSQTWVCQRLTFPFSDIILSNSEAGLRSYNTLDKKSHCIQNGFDFNRINNLELKSDVKRRFSIKTKYIVGMIAYFSERKDYKSYIQCAQKLIDSKHDITFLAIGDGPTLDNIKQMLRPYDKEKIKFLGVQSDVESIINILDIGILLSNNDIHGEGISNSILEYMALGKPVIATKGGGTRELVVDEQNGFLINSGDIEQLNKKLTWLLINNDIAKSMGKKSKQIIKSKFDISIMIEKYQELYISLV